MWVIIEGVDGSGKTTLATAVAELSGATVEHLGPPDPDSGDELDRVIGGPFATYAPGDGIDLVSDRHHWGPPTYGPIKRPEGDEDGYGELGKAGWRYAELFVESRGGATILVDVDPHVAKMRMAEREAGADYIDSSHVDDVVDRYDWLARGALTLTARVTLSEPDDTHKSALAVVEWARSKELDSAPLAGFKHYVGSTRPRLLVIMPPDRVARLRVVNSFDDDAWRRVGIASTAMTEPMFEELYETLDSPAVHGFDKIPGHLEHAMVEHGASFTRDVSEVHKFMPF